MQSCIQARNRNCAVLRGAFSVTCTGARADRICACLNKGVMRQRRQHRTPALPFARAAPNIQAARLCTRAGTLGPSTMALRAAHKPQELITLTATLQNIALACHLGCMRASNPKANMLLGPLVCMHCCSLLRFEDCVKEVVCLLKGTSLQQGLDGKRLLVALVQQANKRNEQQGTLAAQSLMQASSEDLNDLAHGNACLLAASAKLCGEVRPGVGCLARRSNRQAVLHRRTPCCWCRARRLPRQRPCGHARTPGQRAPPTAAAARA